MDREMDLSLLLIRLSIPSNPESIALLLWKLQRLASLILELPINLIQTVENPFQWKSLPEIKQLK